MYRGSVRSEHERRMRGASSHWRELMEEKLQEAEAEIAENEQKLEDAKKELAEGEEAIKNGWEEYDYGMMVLNSGWSELSAYGPQLEAARAQLDAGKAQLDALQEAARPDPAEAFMRKFSFGLLIAVLAIQLLEGVGLLSMFLSMH